MSLLVCMKEASPGKKPKNRALKYIQQQILAGGGARAKVVQGAVIEAGALPCEHMQGVRVFLLQLLVAAEGSRLLAVVLNDDDFKIRVGGLAVDGLHAHP